MLHHILIANRAGKVLISRHFDSVPQQLKLEWEGKLRHATEPEWPTVHDEIDALAYFGDKCTVWTGIGDLLIFVTGSDDYDELMTADVLHLLIAVLKTLCKNVNEAQIFELYHKIVIAIDSMVNKGNVESFDAGVIMRSNHLKWSASASS